MTMENYFNLRRYQELLELKKQNKILLLDKNFMELIKYKSAIKKQISYNRKQDYFSLISEFLNRNLEIHEFESQINELQKEDDRKSKKILENFQNLQSFSLASDLEMFNTPINNILEACFDFYESLADDVKPMTKNELYELVNKYYFQLQTSFPTTVQEIAENTKREYEKLVSDSFKFLGINLGFSALLLFFNNVS